MNRERYVAHIRKSDKVEQGVFQHNDEVANLASLAGRKYGLAHVAELAGRLHDAGKNTDAFLTYIRGAAEGRPVVRGSVTHSTHGAVLISGQANPESQHSRLAGELIRTAIISHHGLRDCLSTDGKLTYAEAAERAVDSIGGVQDLVRSHYGDSAIQSEFALATGEVRAVLDKINGFLAKGEAIGKKLGSPHFYLAMYVRLLTSVLIDADRTNTACFEDGVSPPSLQSPQDRKVMWANCLYYYEDEIGKLPGKKEHSILDQYRSEISQACAEFDGGESGIFRLVVPCGAGKTLSALRYALHTAQRYGKSHIFYIAPYNSILDQNASEIEHYVGSEDAVLEHHSGIVFEGQDSEEEKRYHLLAENWAHSPIIATTAVQFLNTLFARETSSVRRMQALGDSVIILDEIQALPIKVLKMFNAAMNFLAYFCNSSIVLCSATQPLLDKLDNYQIVPPQSIIEGSEKYVEAFKRVEIVDHTGNALSIDEAAAFVLERSCDAKSVLAIVNTKSCARRMFEHILAAVQDYREYKLFHLSTNMCPSHRKEVLEQMRTDLASDDKSQRVICVSTSLIEAGVDVSFEYVVRSLTGLDSVIQAAGRCNRNGKAALGKVSVIYIQDERIGQIDYLGKAQEVTRDILWNIRTSPERYPGGALSKVAMDEFYARYFQPLLEQMAYPLKDDPEKTIIDLLTTNHVGSKRYSGELGKVLLRQAFKEAGSAFAVIDEQGKYDVVVEYNKDAIDHIEKLRKADSLAIKHGELRYLQKYTVQLSGPMLDKLSVWMEESTGVYVLSGFYYHEYFGVTDEPKPMIVGERR